MSPEKIIVVSNADFWLYGCPHCGYYQSAAFIYHYESGATLWSCAEPKCSEGFVTLPTGLQLSPIAFNGVQPQLQAHPRQGIPKHGLPIEPPNLRN